MNKIARRKLAAHLARELHAGTNLQKLVDQTTAYLVEQKQTGTLELLIRDIEAELANTYDTVPVRVASAHPLDASTKTAIKNFVKQAEGAASVVITDETTDTALIGGAVITTPSSTFDSSVRTKLRQLRATTKE